MLVEWKFCFFVRNAMKWKFWKFCWNFYNCLKLSEIYTWRKETITLFCRQFKVFRKFAGLLLYVVNKMIQNMFRIKDERVHLNFQIFGPRSNIFFFLHSRVKGQNNYRKQWYKISLRFYKTKTMDFYALKIIYIYFGWKDIFLNKKSNE